ncbi:MAG: TRAP transporter small permease [Granulosicoccus sp.]
MPAIRRYLQQGLELFSYAMAALAALCMVGIVMIITAAVVMRRLVGAPLHITEDIVGLMLSAVLFLGLPLVTLRSRHVRVSIVVNVLPARFAVLADLAAMLVGILFFGWIFIKALPWIEFAFVRNLKSETARLLLYPWMVILPVSVGLTWVIFAARLTGFLERESYETAEALRDTGSPPTPKDV